MQWGVMPPLTRWLDPWLQAQGAEEPRAWRYATAAMVLVLLILTALFRLVTG